MQSLPVWAVALAAVLSALLFVWRMWSLMASTGQKLHVLKALGVMAAAAVMLGAIKNNGFNHALALLTDALLAITVATFPYGAQWREVNRITVQAGKQQSLSSKDGRGFAVIVVAVLSLLLALEYIVF